MELISVIVPIFNVEKYLNRCIESLLNQTYKNIELILVDDGSTDRCGEICDMYAIKDSRVKVIHKKNGGLSDARNVGLNIARGYYISFVDSDDWVHSDYLKLMYEYLVNNNADICECDILITSNFVTEITDTIITTDLYDTKSALRELIKDTVFHQHVWNKLYKKESINGIKFPIGKINEDEFWTYKVFGNCNRIVKLNKVLYYYFQRNTSIMGSKYNLNRLDALKAKSLRQSYIQEFFPSLVNIAKVNFYNSCVYAGQMSLKYLDRNDLILSKKYINQLLKTINLDKNDLLLMTKSERIYAKIGKLNFWILCRIKNFLKKGL